VEPKAIRARVAKLYKSRAIASFRAMTADCGVNRSEYQKLADLLDQEIRETLGDLPSNTPPRPAILYTKEFGVLFLQRIRGNSATYVSAENFDMGKLSLEVENPLDRLARESLALDDEEVEGSLEEVSHETLEEYLKLATEKRFAKAGEAYHQLGEKNKGKLLNLPAPQDFTMTVR